MCYATYTPSVRSTKISGVKIAHPAVGESGGHCGKFSTRVGKTWTSRHPIARRCGVRQAGRRRSPHVRKGANPDAEQHRSDRLPPQSRTRSLELTPPSSPPESSIQSRHLDRPALAFVRLSPYIILYNQEITRWHAFILTVGGLYQWCIGS
jgi:hypothetical protein